MGELSFMVPLTKGQIEELQCDVAGSKFQIVAGDTKLIWDADNKDEVEAAAETFRRLVEKKKYAAFSVDKKGEQGKKITAFDPDLEKIILVPPLAGG